MDKSKLNFIIDALMFLCMIVIAGMGFLIKYTLLTGKERWIIYSRNVDLFLFGIDRHEWGSIHLVVGFILIGLVILHIILHWGMIIAMYRKLIPSPKTRKIILSIFTAISVFFIIYPFIVSPELVELGQGRGRYDTWNRNEKEIKEISVQPDKSQQSSSHETQTFNGYSIEVKGYMILADVAQEYNVPIEHLKEKLGIPESTSGEQRLGWLRKEFGFKVRDVEKIIYDYNISH